MGKNLKFSLLLLLLSIGNALMAQSGARMLELSSSYFYNSRPSAIQGQVIQDHITKQFGTVEADHRRIIPSGSLNFALNISKPILQSANFSNETEIYGGFGMRLEKRLVYVVERETLVDEVERDQLLARTVDRETFRYFENHNGLQLQLGLAHTIHLNRLFNLNFRTQISAGLPFQNKLVIGRELKREQETISEEGVERKLEHIHLNTNELNQQSYQVIGAQLACGMDYKPFPTRMVFLSLSYVGTRNYYYVNRAKTIDHSSGLRFAVRSNI